MYFYVSLCLYLLVILKFEIKTIFHHPFACFVQVDFVMEILSKLVSKQVCQLKLSLRSFEFHVFLALDAWLK